ncbi:MAG: hypothetical protein ABIA62_03640 [Candidatus Woesearchaeota archaeon]
MRQKTKHTLITAEILGFFLIIIGILGILTGRPVFIKAAAVLFFLIVVVAFLFAVFATLAVKEHRGTWKPKKKK